MTKPIISLIAAMDTHRVIGADNQLIWSLPDDLQWFKQQTLAKPIIMGRKTYESMGRPLPKRTNIILTQQQDYQVDGCHVVHDVEAAIQCAQQVEDVTEIMIIGGAQIYKLFLPFANRMYLTFIDHSFSGDSYFPEWNKDEWDVIENHEHAIDEQHAHRFHIQTLDRKA